MKLATTSSVSILVSVSSLMYCISSNCNQRFNLNAIKGDPSNKTVFKTNFCVLGSQLEG